MKRILVAALSAIVLFTSCQTELFNGKDLSGWTGTIAPLVQGRGERRTEINVPVEQVFNVAGGYLNVSGRPNGYLRTETAYSNYRLHVEWRWVGAATNSGIFVGIQDGDKVWPDCVECNLMADHAGDIYFQGNPQARLDPSPCEAPVGGWNYADIICKGCHIKIFINGKLQNEFDSPYDKGYIGLQSEGGQLEFRNIYLK